MLFGRVFEQLCFRGLQQAAVDIFNATYGLANFKAGRGIKRTASAAGLKVPSQIAKRGNQEVSGGTSADGIKGYRPMGIYNVSNNCWLSSSWQCLVRSHLSVYSNMVS